MEAPVTEPIECNMYASNNVNHRRRYRVRGEVDTAIVRGLMKADRR